MSVDAVATGGRVKKKRPAYKPPKRSRFTVWLDDKDFDYVYGLSTQGWGGDDRKMPNVIRRLIREHRERFEAMVAPKTPQ